MLEDDRKDVSEKNDWILYVYDFSVDYDAILVDDILDIHKYLIKKTQSNNSRIII